MKIADIIRGKGAGVTTVRTGSTMSDAVAVLAEQRIGARVPVSDDGRTLSGNPELSAMSSGEIAAGSP